MISAMEQKEIESRGRVREATVSCTAKRMLKVASLRRSGLNKDLKDVNGLDMQLLHLWERTLWAEQELWSWGRRLLTCLKSSSEVGASGMDWAGESPESIFRAGALGRSSRASRGHCEDLLLYSGWHKKTLKSWGLSETRCNLFLKYHSALLTADWRGQCRGKETS